MRTRRSSVAHTLDCARLQKAGSRKGAGLFVILHSISHTFSLTGVNKKYNFLGLSCTIIILLFGRIVSAQNKLSPYDTTLVSTKKGVNFAFSVKRGIRDSDGAIYYVSGDGKFVEAYKCNSLLWKTDAVAPCGEFVIGDRRIRYIQSDSAVIHVVVGKHSWVKISKSTGLAVFQGSD